MFKAVVEYFDEEERCPLVPKRMLLVFKKIVGNNNIIIIIIVIIIIINNNDNKQMVFVGVYIRLQATPRAVSKNFKLLGICKSVGY